MKPVLPPEWAPQAATLLAWPCANGDWGTALPAARDAIAGMIEALAARQQVVLVARDPACLDSIRQHPRLARVPDARLTVVVLPIDDLWLRDTGPMTVFVGGQRRFLDFRFNGWGGRYPCAADDALGQRLRETGRLGHGEWQTVDWVLEGGSIDGNGRGALLTTERCLLHDNRNPGLDRTEIERRLRDALGVERVHWLAHGGLEGDDTDGHIDTLARFVAADHIVYQGCTDPADPHYAELTAMGEELGRLRDSHDRPYRLTALPLPRPIRDDDGRRLPAGYANFLLANELVLVPAYADPADAEAHSLLARCFPRRRLVPIDCRGLIRQNGALHCTAMQIPAEPGHA